MDGGYERLETKIDGLAETFKDFRDDTRRWQTEMSTTITKRLDVHSGRLGSLERWRSWITGALAMLAGVWAVFQFFWKATK